MGESESWGQGVKIQIMVVVMFGLYIGFGRVSMNIEGVVESG